MNNKLFIQAAKEMFPLKVDEYAIDVVALRKLVWAEQRMESPFMQQLQQRQNLENLRMQQQIFKNSYKIG